MLLPVIRLFKDVLPSFPQKLFSNHIKRNLSQTLQCDSMNMDELPSDLPPSLFDSILNNNKNPCNSDFTHFEQFSGKTSLIYDFTRPIRKYQRIGLYGIKLGSSSMFLSKTNKCVHVTLIQLKDNIVVDRYIVDSFNYKLKRLGIMVAGIKANPQEYAYIRTHAKIICEKYKIEQRLMVGGFYVDPDYEPKIGSTYGASFFRPDQFVSIVSRTKDRGFLGVMQRWNFKGLPKTHGVSVSHRHGGHVQSFKKHIYPGSKMPGHTGLKLQQNPPRKILRVNTVHNVIYIMGSIHGYKKAPLLVRDFNPTEPYQPPENCPEDLYSDSVLPYDYNDVLNDSSGELQEKLEEFDKKTTEHIELNN